MISLRSICLTCALLALFAMPAFSTPVLYTDWNSWLNAVTSPSTVTFAVGSYNNSTGFTTGLALPDNPTFVGMLQMGDGSNPPCSTYQPGNCSLQVLNHNTSPYFNYGNLDPLAWGAYTSGNVLSSSLHITWPTPVTAIALNLLTWGGSGITYNVQLNGDSNQVFTSSPTVAGSGAPSEAFLGFVSSTPISSIDFYLPSGTGASPLLNQFSYVPSGSGSTGQTGDQDPSQIPELQTFLLIASGLIGMALVGRRARRAAANA